MPGNVQPSVSMLIPARNEESCIRSSVLAALDSRGVNIEMIVLDDHSDDKTGEIVRDLHAMDNRVRLETAPACPPDGAANSSPVLSCLALLRTTFSALSIRTCGCDPDGLARMVAFLRKSNASLVSGFPHQELGTFYEKLLLPLMHFLLLGFLPLDYMRKFRAPSLGAGCGQIFVAEKAAYLQAGGHGAIRASRHDGIKLPKAFRRIGLHTDLCDATDVADCRMYHSADEVFSGLLKNANEGIAAPVRIFVFTALLLLGHVVPELLVILTAYRQQFGQVFWLSACATILSLLTRVLAAYRFRQPWIEAFMHPWAILVFLALQWKARYRDLSGRPAVWKGRSYQTT